MNIQRLRDSWNVWRSKIDEAIGSFDPTVISDMQSEIDANARDIESLQTITDGLGTASTKNSTDSVTEGSTDLLESGAAYTVLSAKANSSDLGTASAKDSTDAVTQNSTDLVESGAVYTEMQSIRESLTNISITGTTNDTGATIVTNTSFFLNGALAKAKIDIANGDTLTLNTNYVLLPKGGFNEIGQIAVFTNNIHLYRIDRLRILTVEGDTFANLTSITLPSVDRPSNVIREIFDYFGRIGVTSVNPDGTITTGYYINYGDSTITDISSATSTARCTLLWLIT